MGRGLDYDKEIRSIRERDYGWISLTNDWMDYCNEAIRLDMSSESKDRDIMSYLSDGLFLAAQEKYEDEIVGLRKILEKVREKC